MGSTSTDRRQLLSIAALVAIGGLPGQAACVRGMVHAHTFALDGFLRLSCLIYIVTYCMAARHHQQYNPQHHAVPAAQYTVRAARATSESLAVCDESLAGSDESLAVSFESLAVSYESLAGVQLQPLNGLQACGARTCVGREDAGPCKPLGRSLQLLWGSVSDAWRVEEFANVL